jgi:hypothetical protein
MKIRVLHLTGGGWDKPVLRVLDHLKMAGGSGDEEGGPVHRIYRSRSLAAVLDHNEEELHFWVAIWIVRQRRF